MQVVTHFFVLRLHIARWASRMAYSYRGLCVRMSGQESSFLLQGDVALNATSKHRQVQIPKAFAGMPPRSEDTRRQARGIWCFMASHPCILFRNYDSVEVVAVFVLGSMNRNDQAPHHCNLHSNLICVSCCLSPFVQLQLLFRIRSP